MICPQKPDLLSFFVGIIEPIPMRPPFIALPYYISPGIIQENESPGKLSSIGELLELYEQFLVADDLYPWPTLEEQS